ncbi:MAG: hypothetical protein AAFV72_07670 [Cyanobacteria bacterium J06635_1]
MSIPTNSAEGSAGLDVVSLLGWFVLFQGLAPAASYGARLAPDVQRSLWAVTPGTGLYFVCALHDNPG